MAAAAAPASAIARATRTKPNKWVVTISVTFGTLMGAIDSSIVNVALPHIRGTVGATIQEITWISTSFVVATVLVMPLTGFFARMFGQKQVYMFCLVLFLLGSALCGTAHSLPQLVAYRALQGFGAGALQPTEQAILRQTFPPKEQGMAMALFAMAVMLGPAIGPTLGGYIVDHYDWPWIFYINLPIGALGLFMVYTFVHEDEEIRAQNRVIYEKQRRHMDWLGIALLVVGLCAMQYFLEEGASRDWFDDAAITVSCIVGALAIGGFVWRELVAPAPIVDLSLFRDPVFLSGTMIGALMFAMLMANMFLLPIFMQEILGFNATQAGWALMPRVVVMMLVTPIVGKLYNLVSARVIIAFGVFMFGIGAWQMSKFTLATGSGDIVAAIAIQGVGFACLFVPLTTVALASIPRHRMTDATGLNSLLRQIGGSIGLAVFATLLGRFAVQAQYGVSAHVGATDPATWSRVRAMEQAFVAKGMNAIAAHEAALRALAGTVARQSMVLSFEKIFLLAGILFLAVLPMLLFLKTKDAGGEVAEVHLDA